MSPSQLSLPPLIEVPELLQLQRQSSMGITDLCLFDCRTETANGSQLGLPFVPGARLLDHHPHLKTPNDEGKPGLFIMPPKAFAEWAGRRGISKDSHVIAYDHAKGVSASRLWWSLRHYGHLRVQVLNGGMKAWEAAGQKTAPDAEVPSKALFEAHHDPRIVANHERVGSAKDTNTVVIDVRTPGEWEGKDLRGNPRGGHIPGAVHIPFDHMVDEQGRWRDERAIKGVLSEAGVQEGAPLITHCQAGIRASHLALSLVRAGWQDVRVYDGSFKDYSRRRDLPLESTDA